MLDVFGTPYEPPRLRWMRPPRFLGRIPRYMAPALSATVLAALILHLLVELTSRLTSDDPAGTLSVLLGVLAVLVILLPFTILCVRRAQAAWCGADASGKGGPAKPRPATGLASDLG